MKLYFGLGAENLLRRMFKDCGMLVERYAQTIAFCFSRWFGVSVETATTTPILA
jgi:hypothetical protein